jgi:hypothetical protein
VQPPPAGVVHTTLAACLHRHVPIGGVGLGGWLCVYGTDVDFLAHHDPAGFQCLTDLSHRLNRTIEVDEEPPRIRTIKAGCRQRMFVDVVVAELDVGEPRVLSHPARFVEVFRT